SVVGIFLINFAITSPQALFAYPHFLGQTGTIEFGTRYWFSFTFNALLVSLPFIQKSPGVLLVMINCLAYAAVFLLCLRKVKQTDFADLFLIGSIATALFSLHFHVYDLFFWIISISLLAERFFVAKNQIAKQYLVIGILLYFL